MALIYEGICCALCDQVIDNDTLDSDDFVATTHFIGDQQNPLWRFSDAAMHRSCFLAWDKREAFVQAYNEAMRDCFAGNGTRTQMDKSGEIIILNRAGEVVNRQEKEKADEEFVDRFLASLPERAPKTPRRKKGAE